MAARDPERIALIGVNMEDHFLPPEVEKELYDKLACPKTLMTFSGEMMAAGHCQMGAITTQSQRILDWLEETLSTFG